MEYIIPVVLTSPPNELDTQTVLILFVEIVIIIIYLVSLLLVIIRRAKKLLELNNRKYYIVIIIYIATKIVLCGILIFQVIVGMAKDWSNIDPAEVQLLIKTGIILADFCMIELFLVALQTYLTHCFSAMSDVFTNSRSKLLSNALNIMQLIVGLVLLIPLLIFDVNQVAYDVINGVSIGLNLIIIISFLATFFYMNFKMTGVLMENKLNDVIKRIYKVQLIILVSRACSLVFQIMIAMYVLPKSFQEQIQTISTDIKYQIILGTLFVGSVLFILITEGLPIMYSLRSAVVTALNHKSQLVVDKQSIFTDHSSALEQSLVENEQEDYRKEVANNKELKFKNFTRVLDLKTQKQQSIWVLKKGHFDGKDYMIRISKHEISSYILEDIENELGNLIHYNIKSLSKMSYFCQGQIIHLVEKYYEVPLQKKILNATSENQIIRLALQIAEGIKQLHILDISHGCLAPQHIYFDQSQVIFNGFGLHSFKKYLSLITGYNNKSIYTAIEHLKDKNNVILKPKRSSDIYSFGIIFYELVTKNIQYRQLTLHDIQTKFAEQNFRPKLPEHIKYQIKNLIRKCWNEVSQKRPTIDEVIETLRKLT